MHDYTNRSNASSNAMSLSGAQVKVYKGNDLLKTYNVPINIGGTRWNVFEIKNGEVGAINNIAPRTYSDNNAIDFNNLPEK